MLLLDREEYIYCDSQWLHLKIGGSLSVFSWMVYWRAGREYTDKHLQHWFKDEPLLIKCNLSHKSHLSVMKI